MYGIAYEDYGMREYHAVRQSTTKQSECFPHHSNVVDQTQITPSSYANSSPFRSTFERRLWPVFRTPYKTIMSSLFNSSLRVAYRMKAKRDLRQTN